MGFKSGDGVDDAVSIAEYEDGVVVVGEYINGMVLYGTR